MKVSLISTVKNEEGNISAFIESIIEQSYQPDEVIIVDGNSTDGTVEVIEGYMKNFPKIKLFARDGNISQGRNFGIKNAKNEVIAVSDAGCVLDKDWLKNMVHKLDKSVDVVSGAFLPFSENLFEYYEGEIICKDINKIDESSFLPSSRSVMFKRTAWENVGGYPEGYYTGEDTLFCLKLKENGYKFRFAKDAIVYWKMRKNWKAFFRQFFLYGVGDGETGNIVSLKMNLLFVIGFSMYLVLLGYYAMANPWVFLFLAGLGLLYPLWWGIRLTKKSKNIKGLYYGAGLITLKRAGYFLGVLKGLITRRTYGYWIRRRGV